MDQDASEQFASPTSPEFNTPYELEEAVSLLQAFSIKEISDVSSLKDADEALGEVGKALLSVAFHKGRKNNDQFIDYQPIDNESYHLSEDEDLPEKATGTAINLRSYGKEFVVLSKKSTPYGAPPTQGVYEILIPTSSLSNPSPHLSDAMISGQLFVLDEWMDIQPRKNQDDPQVFRQYTSLVKQGVKDFLAAENKEVVN